MKRDTKDFTVEFGRYLAQAAENYLDATNGCEFEHDGVTDSAKALRSAVYEFLRRAAKTDK